MKHNSITLLVVIISIILLSCEQKKHCHEEMKALLKVINSNHERPDNLYFPKAKLKYMDSLLQMPHSSPSEIRYCKFLKGNILLELGEEKSAIRLFESIITKDDAYIANGFLKKLALAYLRQGERANCIASHASESCILPIQGLGLHNDLTGSKKAIVIYQKILQQDPNDYESRWLMNIAYMTLGEYPELVPKSFLLPDMEGDSTVKINAFQDIAGGLNLDINNMAGGSVTDDFDNDGYLDLFISCWGLSDNVHYFKNNADGTFTDATEKANLSGITGGLNVIQADYNNDGYKDLFILRGAWRGELGKEPNSLLKNNGDGTFTDVTTISGLLSFHPTQTATWNDFNNDGWIDIFIGNESSINFLDPQHPCELYVNNKNGTFTEIAYQAKCNLSYFVKGVTSGDYDNDGLNDIFISTLNGRRILLKNKSNNSTIVFEDVTAQAGLDKHFNNTFPTWFWDYNNDGWLDIFVCDYTFDKSLAYYAALEKLNLLQGDADKMLLYRNNHDGTFTNVAKEVGLDETVFAMGSNFGDIDNDGYLDMYLGSGNPLYESIVPNKMFKNIDGKKFANVTASARVGHLQKGHGVSFADMDNDGDQDIYIEMGGAYTGDAYQNSFFLNPGQGTNNWICLSLEGKTSNRSAIGARIKITFKENGVLRNVYRDVNSGGSFGSSPLRKEIGIGEATVIDEIEIRWPASNKLQIFKNIKTNQFLKITEEINQPELILLKPINWTLTNTLCI